MNIIHKQRVYFIGLLIIGLSIASSLILYAFKQNLNAFVTPSQLLTNPTPPDYHVRLGGLVKKNSLKRDNSGLGMQFVVTDLKKDIVVRYVGILPDLFREGKGAVMNGILNTNGMFIATQVLAKHDENYTPKKIETMLRQNGVT